MKKKSISLYEPHLTSLENLLMQSKTQNDPAYWLYLNKARSPLFNLEALTRLMARTTNDPIAKSGEKLFKKLEDRIGEIDYYDAFVKQFSQNKAVKQAQVSYLIKKRDKALLAFNDKLGDKEFYISKINDFREKAELDIKNKGLMINLHEQLKTEILRTEEFFNEHKGGFNDFEEQVHAMRRKIRWISIYSASLGGLVILKDSKNKYPWEKEFITKTETTSKYNQLPVKSGLSYYIPLNKKAFYALSHVVDQLGIIKDKGLAVEALAGTIEKTENVKHSNPKLFVTRQLKLRETEDFLLKQAYDITYKFFVTYKIHLELIKP